MKTFKQLITEKRTNNMIIVDVQPMYEQYLKSRINMYDFVNFIMEQRNIIFYYNGTDTLGDDTKRDIIEWLYEYSDYNDELYKKLTSKNDVIWYDKGYGFFRSWMDEGADTGFIIKAIRYMLLKRVYDSREIDPEEWKEEFPYDWEDYMEYDPLIIPDIPLNVLKKFSGSYLAGGGKNECLAEVQILMNAFNIRYKLVRKFIY